MNSLVEGTKYDTGKLRYDLLPAYPLDRLVAVYTYGAAKYEDENWRKGISYKRIFGAIMRHCWAFMRGEDIDAESQLPHLAHAAFGLFTLLEYSRTRREFDDRVKDDEKVYKMANEQLATASKSLHAECCGPQTPSPQADGFASGVCGAVPGNPDRLRPFSLAEFLLSNSQLGTGGRAETYPSGGLPTMGSDRPKPGCLCGNPYCDPGSR